MGAKRTIDTTQYYPRRAGMHSQHRTGLDDDPIEDASRGKGRGKQPEPQTSEKDKEEQRKALHKVRLLEQAPKA